MNAYRGYTKGRRTGAPIAFPSSSVRLWRVSCISLLRSRTTIERKEQASEHATIGKHHKVVFAFAGGQHWNDGVSREDETSLIVRTETEIQTDCRAHYRCLVIRRLLFLLSNESIELHRLFLLIFTNRNRNKRNDTRPAPDVQKGDIDITVPFSSVPVIC